MQSGWRVGTLFGIPFFIDPSWLFVLVGLTFVNGLNWQSAYPQWGIPLAWGTGAVMALLLFSSVLLHELGHSLVAQQQGITVTSITLFLFGGMASIEQESKTPGKALQVAIAGPAVSIALYGFLSFLAWQMPIASPIQVAALDLARINFILAIFNLIPGLPLDGGQILRAIVWKITGNRLKGTRWAAKTGQALGWTAIIFGLGSVLLLHQSSSLIWLALIGGFVVRNASSYDRVTNLQEALMQIEAAQAMNHDWRVVDANLTLRQFADEYLLANTHPPVYFAASDGRYRGMVMPEQLSQVERSEWDQTLERILVPLEQLTTVQEKTLLVTVINLMEAHELSRIPVLSPAGAVAGVIDRGDIVQAVITRLKTSVPEAEIRQIKDEGSYPPGLQLQAIAKLTAESLTIEA